MLNKADLLSSLSCSSLALTNALEPTPTLVTSASPPSIEELFKLFMQTYMDTVKNQTQVQALVQVPPPQVEPKEKPLKVHFLDLYFGKLYLDCYRFCQQCKDYFDTSRVNRDNCTPFAAFFL